MKLSIGVSDTDSGNPRKAQSIRGNAKNVRYADACKVAEWRGFTAKGQSSAHNAFSRPGEVSLLNFQNRDGMIKPYQARQLQAMIEKYWVDDDKSKDTLRESEKPASKRDRS